MPQEYKEKQNAPKLSQTQKMLGAIIQWSPFGASSYPFMSFLLKQEWVPALSIFPITIGTLVWAAYSRSFIERFSEIYAERGKHDADALTLWLNGLNETLKWKLSDFDNKYLKQQRKVYQLYTTEGFNSNKIAIPLLDEVFVPLQLSGYLGSSTSDSLDIWDVIRRSRKDTAFRQIAIIGSGGFGKTTLLHHVLQIYSQKEHHRYDAPKLIPFLLYLREWLVEIAQANPPNLPTLITKYYLPRLFGNTTLSIPPKWADILLQQGKALVMLDGFDELPTEQRRGISYWISQQMQEYDHSIFIITSRPTGYQDYISKRPTVPLFVQKFSQVQQEAFIRRWYLCQERSFHSEKQAAQAKVVAEKRSQNLLSQLVDPDRIELRVLSENPLLLNMLTTFHRCYYSELPRQRTELYNGIFKIQLNDRPNVKQIRMHLSFAESQVILQAIALEMAKTDQSSISYRELMDFLEMQVVLEFKNINLVDWLQEIVQVSELLVEREPGEYEFAHINFQNYLAAIEIHNINQENMLLEHVNNPFWQEIILFYIETLREPKNFIRKLVTPIPNPYVVGNPITGSLFVGREDILLRFEELWNTTGQIPSVVLYGHRRMGKTSVLRNLPEKFCQDLIIDFNMQRVGDVKSSGELLYNLALAIYDALPNAKEYLDEPVESDFLEKNSSTTFDRFLKKVDIFRNNQKIIIAIDEFEIIEELIYEGKLEARLLGFWRSLIQTYSWFVMVFAGLHTLQEKTHDYWNPLFGSVQVIPVSFINPKAAKVLITSPSPEFNLDYDPDAVTLIYKLTYGQPYLIQLICHNLVTYFNRQRFEEGIYRQPPLTAQDVEAVINMPEFYRDGNAYFNG
ncbi:MAG: AAA family ATPase, partial [bacterium]|nr:AAA family ATPase [bacterium]